MEKRKDEEKVISIKNAVIKKTPQILYWISGVGSQRYPMEFIKKGISLKNNKKIVIIKS